MLPLGIQPEPVIEIVLPLLRERGRQEKQAGETGRGRKNRTRPSRRATLTIA